MPAIRVTEIWNPRCPVVRDSAAQGIRKACLQRAAVGTAGTLCSLDLIPLMVLTCDSGSLREFLCVTQPALLFVSEQLSTLLS